MYYSVERCSCVSQVLVLTHERATPEEQEGYLAALWPGVPISVVYGRSYAEAPTIPKSHSVWYGWKDLHSIYKVGVSKVVIMLLV